MVRTRVSGGSVARRAWAYCAMTALCLLAPCVHAADAPPITAPLHVLPSGHIAVQVRIDGKGPFHMILDTGAPISILGTRAAQQVGLLSSDAAKQPAMMGLRGMGAVKTLQLGDLKAHDLEVMVMEHPIVALLSQIEGPLDGILGFSFFSRYQTTLDYAAGSISFTPVAYRPSDVLSSMVGEMFSDQAARRVIQPAALWGLSVDKPDGAAGVRITRIYAGSAADEAGLKVGDRLLTLDGRWADSVNDCSEAAVFVSPGESVTVTALRDGKELSLQVVPRLGL